MCQPYLARDCFTIFSVLITLYMHTTSAACGVPSPIVFLLSFFDTTERKQGIPLSLHLVGESGGFSLSIDMCETLERSKQPAWFLPA